VGLPAAEGKRALLLVWDNASWRVSQRVRVWIRTHNRRVKAEGGVRIISCPLPVKAPWLNAIEPKWVHGKRAIVEPERKLTAAERLSGKLGSRFMLIHKWSRIAVFGRCQTPQHPADRTDPDPRLARPGTPLVVPAMPPVPTQPREAPLDGLIANDKFCMTRLLRMAHEHRPTP
jgi:hypothetical protein